MSKPKLITLLISALGGQGGGVLVDWLVAAARMEGFPAQATSIPGVAQRTGATTYYLEIWSEQTPDTKPVFSIYPASGQVDLQVSFEPTEASRALMNGFIGPQTSVITASRRIFSTAEKIRPGDATIPAMPVLEAIKACAGDLKVLDVSTTAQKAGCHPNAVMFGAIQASGILPFFISTCRKAISNAGKAVETNLAGFEAGSKLQSLSLETFARPEPAYENSPPAFEATVKYLPECLRKIAGHSLAHLVDYQDDAYARLYLERLATVIAVDDKAKDFKLSQAVARYLAAWMAFEDVIRVAQLKTRPGRFARIRQELAASGDIPVAVHDYLKPGRQELLGLLPKTLAERFSDKPGSGVPLKIKTSSPAGFAVMKLLASLRKWRPKSGRYFSEQALIVRWLDLVIETAQQDYDLACAVAELAVWARGYGQTRQRGFDQLETVLANNQNLAQAVKTSLAEARQIP